MKVVQDKIKFKTKFFFSELTDESILEYEFKNDPHRYFIEVDYKNYSKVYRFTELPGLWNRIFYLEKQLKDKTPSPLDLKLKINTFKKANLHFQNNNNHLNL